VNDLGILHYIYCIEGDGVYDEFSYKLLVDLGFLSLNRYGTGIH